MKEFTVIAYREFTQYEKCYINVQADTPEQALLLAKQSPEDYDIDDYKVIDCGSAEFIDEDQWSVL